MRWGMSASQDELDSQHLGASPNDLANPVLTALEKCHFKAARDRRWYLYGDFRALLREVQNLAFAKLAPLRLDPRRKSTGSANLSLKMLWLHCRPIWIGTGNRPNVLLENLRKTYLFLQISTQKAGFSGRCWPRAAINVGFALRRLGPLALCKRRSSDFGLTSSRELLSC
jgi:hypothetical protein